jgi:ubiquinone/menaquinone biosynthesis C-methylase UbiE
VTDPVFRRDLFRGAARDYDQFRLTYPRELTENLARRCGASGSGRLLDLGCGTGQLTFALHGHFEQTWAVDQEPDMIDVVREKAAGIGGIRPVVSAAEDLDAPAEGFDLVVAGNAFHRLQRDRVAASVFRWLRPGGFLALVWSSGPSDGEAPWQQALSEAMRRWRARAAGEPRVPPGWAQARSARPDQVILSEAGFEVAGHQELIAEHEWTPETVTGFLFGTSVLTRAALGSLAGEFEADIRRELLAADPVGRFRQSVSFACELFCKGTLQ